MINLFNYPGNLDDLLHQLNEEQSSLSHLSTAAWLQLIQKKKQWSDQELAHMLGLTLNQLQQQKKHRGKPSASKLKYYTNLLLE